MTISQTPQGNRPGEAASAPSDTPVKIFLVTISLAGVLSVPTFFLQASMPRNAVLLGLSLPRLLIGAAIILIEISLTCLTVLALRRPGLISRALKPIDSRTAANPSFMVATLLVLLYVAVVAGYLLTLFRMSLVPHAPYLLRVGFERGFGVLLWLAVMPSLLFVALACRYSQQISVEWHQPSGSETHLLLFLVTLLATLHLITLHLQASWVLHIEGWFWPYTPKHFRPSQLSIPAAVFFALIASYVILRQRRISAIYVALLFTTAYMLQVGFGFALGHGFESIRAKYEHTQFSDEMRLACESDLTTLAALRDYERVFGQSFWYGTKPPGLLALYSISRDLLRISQPDTSGSSIACFLALSAAFARISPFLSALVVLPLFALERLLRPGPLPVAASLIYMAAPSILLMQMAPDQFIFPLVATLGILAVVVATLRDSWPLALGAGFLLAFQLFLSFSLLPLVGLTLVWLGLLYATRSIGLQRTRLVQTGLAIAIGFLALSTLLAATLDYNPIARFTTAMQQHRDIKAYDFTITHLLQYGLLNSVEIAFWGGLPLAVLAVVAVSKSVRPMLAGNPSLQDTFNISFASAFLAMNAFGQTRGEVGRIWIFMLPLAAIVGASQATRLLRDPTRSLILVFGVQLITSVFAFAFLDWPWFIT